MEAARLAYHETAGAQRGSILSNTSASGEWLLEDLCIVFESYKEPMKDECTRLRNVSQGVFLSVAIRLGPMAMQNIGGLPSVRNDENHNGIEFWASSPRTVPN